METGSVFVLSGEEYSFASAEIRALVETYFPNSVLPCENLSNRVLVSDLKEEKFVSRIAERAAYCRFGGSFISKAESFASLVESLERASIPEAKTFVVSSETLDRNACGDLGALIKQKTGAKVSLEEPDLVYQVERIKKGQLILAVSNDGYKEFTWRQRRPRSRKFFLPSAIYPKLARLLVNLSRVREKEYFLDPFCGTGSLLIESSIIGLKTIGADLTRWIARGALLNLKSLSLDFEGVFRWDSTASHLPLRKVDAISTDVPYGRASSTKGKETSRIVREFTSAAAEILRETNEATAFKKSKYCVVMHPSHIDFDYDKSAFDLEERHLLYVHRTLTRAISVLKTRR